MLQEASLTSEIQKTNTNRFVTISFFRITHFLVKENWAHTNNFKTLMGLLRKCGGKELQTHLLTACKNTIYISAPYVAKYIDILNEYIKAPLFASLCIGKYMLYNEEGKDIS